MISLVKPSILNYKFCEIKKSSITLIHHTISVSRLIYPLNIDVDGRNFCRKTVRGNSYFGFR